MHLIVVSPRRCCLRHDTSIIQYIYLNDVVVFSSTSLCMWHDRVDHHIRFRPAVFFCLPFYRRKCSRALNWIFDEWAEHRECGGYRHTTKAIDSTRCHSCRALVCVCVCVLSGKFRIIICLSLTFIINFDCLYSFKYYYFVVFVCALLAQYVHGRTTVHSPKFHFDRPGASTERRYDSIESRICQNIFGFIHFPPIYLKKEIKTFFFFGKTTKLYCDGRID